MIRKIFLKSQQVTVKNTCVTINFVPWCRPFSRRYVFSTNSEANDFAQKLCETLKENKHTYPRTGKGLTEAIKQMYQK